MSVPISDSSCEPRQKPPRRRHAAKYRLSSLFTAWLGVNLKSYSQSMTTKTSTSTAPVFACNLEAIRAGDRPRYHELVKRVRSAMRDRNELSKGYTFELDHEA